MIPNLCVAAVLQGRKIDVLKNDIERLISSLSSIYFLHKKVKSLDYLINKIANSISGIDGISMRF